MRIVVAALLWLSFTAAASAHALWIEPGEAGFELYFGEFDENLREGSPGLLDRFNPPPAAKAFTVNGLSSVTPAAVVNCTFTGCAPPSSVTVVASTVIVAASASVIVTLPAE